VQKLLPVLMIVGGVVLGLGGVVAATMLTGGALVIGTAPGASAAAAEPKTVEAKSQGLIYPTRERIINLADTGVLRYVKVIISFDIYDPDAKPLPKGEEGKKKLDEWVKETRAHIGPVIDDEITTIITAKTSAELMSAEGKVRLKDELKERITKKLHGQKVLTVYLSEFVIQ